MPVINSKDLFLVNADHFWFSVSHVWLDGVDVTDKGVIWVDLLEQKLCYRAPKEQIIETRDVQGEVVSGKIEVSPVLGNEEAFWFFAETFPKLLDYIRKE